MQSVADLIKGLECCSGETCKQKECPYYTQLHGTCQIRLHEDALKLIKSIAGEPETVRARFFSPYCGKKVGHSQCPGCGKAINTFDNPKACGQCGQMVEWV